MILEEAIKNFEQEIGEFEGLKKIKAVTHEDYEYIEKTRQFAEWLKELKERREKDTPDTNARDTISRQAAIEKFRCTDPDGTFCYCSSIIQTIEALPSAQPDIIRCKDCKYFELDHFEKVDGFPIPIIVAHEICMKWGEGCKSSIDGWCFMAKRRTDE